MPGAGSSLRWVFEHLKAHPRLLITSAGLAAILAVLFTRTTGIHYDELNYISGTL